MKIDFSACAHFKGTNQKPLILAEGAGLFRPTIQRIAEKSIKKDLDAIVLRSYSHPEGTDNRWKGYLEQMESYENFTKLGNGIGLYVDENRKERPLYLIHGQGLMTEKGNIQIFFTDKEIGKRGEYFKKDFDYLIERAREQGEQVLITASRPYLWNIRDLDKIDAIEVHNGIDTKENNRKSQDLALKINKPGVIVSSSKILYDLGSSYTNLSILPQEILNKSSIEIAKKIKNSLSKISSIGDKKEYSNISKFIQTLAILEVMVTKNKD